MGLTKNVTIRRKETRVHVLQEADALKVQESPGETPVKMGEARAGAGQRGQPGRMRDRLRQAECPSCTPRHSHPQLSHWAGAPLERPHPQRSAGAGEGDKPVNHFCFPGSIPQALHASSPL